MSVQLARVVLVRPPEPATFTDPETGSVEDEEDAALATFVTV